MAILKVFSRRSERRPILARARLVESYEAFAVVEATPAAARELAASFPTEDLTAQYQVALGGRSVDPLRAAGGGAPLRLASRERPVRLPPGPHHYVVQFIGPIKSGWLGALRRTGATVRAPFGGFAYLVRASERQLARIRALPSVRWAGHLPHADRIAPGLAEGRRRKGTELPRRRALPGVLGVELFGPELVGPVRRAARALGFTVLHEERRAATLTLQAPALAGRAGPAIRALSAVHGVRFIRQRVLNRTSNDVATGIMGNAWAARQASGLGLTGAGETVAVCDTGLDSGDAASIHPDFAGRVAAIRSYPIAPEWSSYVTNPGGDDGARDLDSGHGTHVAGSVLGDGTASAEGPVRIRGHAFKARLVFQAVEQEMKWKPGAPAELKATRYLLAGLPSDLRPLFQYAYDQGARVHSNSWGGGDAGAYDPQCHQFDDFVWRHKDLCFVIAAGNDGSDADGDGRINPGSVTSPGTAKNVITVGACENRRPGFNGERYGDWWPRDFPVAPYRADPMADDPAEVVAFSSRGPTADGRFKPEVVAPGTFILSTRSRYLAPNNFAWAAYPTNGLYFHMGGTSMATPLTSGAVALLREYLRTRQRRPAPTAALVKALLVAGARRIKTPGVAAPAGAVVDSEQGYGRVDLDRSLKRVLLLDEGRGLRTGQLASQQLTVPASGKTLRVVLAYSDYPGPRLVNNLNLVVTSPAGKRQVGNQAGTALTPDAANNVEVVQVAAAARGTWTIDVVAANVAHGPQDYALAVVLV